MKLGTWVITWEVGSVGNITIYFNDKMIIENQLMMTLLISVIFE